MAEFVFESPVTLAYRYLNGFYPGRVAREDEPPGYKPADLLIIVKSGGGAGVNHRQLSDARLSFEVRCADERTAEHTADRVHALLRDWPWRSDCVARTGTHGLPAWDPEPDRRIPAFTWTMEITFKSTTQLT
ncbi:hypothetical protein [Kocuria sp.]|uniref:hypothetical protein n=1 Tax=Kocuria sp. TaxID=1871328 RepID=UPI0026DD7DD8|nr:hypothetical protein [Kocuria sp.]MDO4919945.1 hypothetical protein [Kocuria sp.]